MLSAVRFTKSKSVRGKGANNLQDGADPFGVVREEPVKSQGPQDRVECCPSNNRPQAFRPRLWWNDVEASHWWPRLMVADHAAPI